MIDFTVPGGGCSLTMSVDAGVSWTEARRDLGSINRILMRDLSAIKLGRNRINLLVV